MNPPDPKHDVSHAVIMLHPACNMTCSFCITRDSFDVMSFQQGVHFLSFLQEAGIHNVIFGGGEPFAWKPDLLALTRQAKAMGLQVQVGTNGISLPPDFEHIESIDRYILPLESVEASHHNGMRFYKNRHHSIILDRLATLKKAGREVTLSTVITQKNIGSLRETAAYLAEYQASGGRIHAWHLYQFIPEGRGGGPNAASLSISSPDYHLACQDIKESDPGFTVFKRSNMFQSKSVGFFWYQDGCLRMAGKPAARAAFSSFLVRSRIMFSHEADHGSLKELC